MKLGIAWLAILCLALAAIPAWAQNRYMTTVRSTAQPMPGPLTLATLSATPLTLARLKPSPVSSFGVWEFPGDTMRPLTGPSPPAKTVEPVYGSGTANGSPD